MCGIAGFVGRGDRGVLVRMTDALIHRGPDAEGFFEDPKAGLHLGHRRLSILDLAGGAQPMHSNDGRLTIVFNGEIYNHAELRRELEAVGRVFATNHSDTEVLLQAYAEWGEDFLPRLNGMWAFVIYDAGKKRLFASRDRFGKKPFYYFQKNGTFAFASELNALLEHPDCPRSVCQQALRKLFAYCLIPAPLSIVEGVSKLPAGHALTLDLTTGSLQVRRWWEYLLEPDAGLTGRTEESLAEELRELLDRAVARRLIADVPLGIFLSGGVDSSAITALAARHRPPSELSTFSIGFKEASFDESDYARRMAEAVGTRHFCRQLSLEDSRDLLPGLLSRLDEPQGDNSILPTWLLCRFARESVTVALGGDGGDELFAGYDPFKALAPAALYQGVVPRPVHAALRAASAWLPVGHSNISLDFKIKRMLRGLSYEAPQWLPAWMGALEPGEIADFLGGSDDPEELYSEAIEAWDRQPGISAVDRATQFFIRIYLQDGILPKVDRASMLNSLEVRAPFLDIEVVNFVRRLPSECKFHRGQGKRLLHTALRGLVPDFVLERKKKGFGSPVGPWFQSGGLRLQPNIGPIPELARVREQSHRDRKSDERLFLWTEYALEQWLSAHRQQLIMP